MKKKEERFRIIYDKISDEKKNPTVGKYGNSDKTMKDKTMKTGSTKDSHILWLRSLITVEKEF